LAADECGLWLGARDPEAGQHHLKGHYFLRFGFVLRFGFAFCGVVTRNGLLAKTFVRVVFISAWRSVAST
jgi:hypothetical protein